MNKRKALSMAIIGALVYAPLVLAAEAPTPPTEYPPIGDVTLPAAIAMAVWVLARWQPVIRIIHTWEGYHPGRRKSDRPYGPPPQD